MKHGPIQRDGTGSRPPPPGKSQMVIGFLRNTGTDPLKKQLEPLGPIAS